MRKLLLSEEHQESKEAEPETRHPLLSVLDKQEKEIRRYKPPKPAKSEEALRREADTRHSIVGVRLNALRRERFVGSLYGLNGRLALQPREALAQLRHLPRELSRQFIFVGIRVPAVERAIRNEPVGEWQISEATRQMAEDNAVYPSADNVIIAPADLLDAAGSRRLTEG